VRPWVDLTIRCTKAARVLLPAGTVAIFTNTHPKPFVSFFARIQDVYDALAPELAHTEDASETER
jgi:hypothetical protein